MSSTTRTSEVVSQPPPDFGTHNMFAFGREAVYLSHLSMFMAPHDAQLILEVALEDGTGGSLSEVWSTERANHPDQRVYTMMPQRFALSTLYTRDPPARRSFRARFFRGHLEQGGEVIPELGNIVVRVTDVVYAKQFDRGGKPDDLTYRLFGRGSELFLAHRIGEPPDFDQILSVQLPGAQPDEDEVNAGIEVVLPSRPNTATERLRDGTATTARGHVTGTHQFFSLEIAGVRELYFEEGELMTSRGAFEPTELEIEARFGD
ncbi:MAG TPA: hypothetical protein VK390_15690 [Propionibacteriaceae bacterium]|nr:hypothetical protein [Propionibacteriaceae bacterium]